MMTDLPNDGGPAFPIPEIRDGDGFCVAQAETGMTLRDYFAAATLPAVIRRFGIMDEPANAVAAEQAYAVADAMLAERNK